MWGWGEIENLSNPSRQNQLGARWVVGADRRFLAS